LEEIEDQDAVRLQEEVGARLETPGIRGLLLDVSVVETLDTFLGRVLGDIARTARLMGLQAVIVGISPSIAMTMVELGLDFSEIRTALDSSRGVALLHRLIGQEQTRTIPRVDR
jgi:rsbT antagonist protein RsbS